MTEVTTLKGVAEMVFSGVIVSNCFFIYQMSLIYLIFTEIWCIEEADVCNK